MVDPLANKKDLGDLKNLKYTIKIKEKNYNTIYHIIK